MQDSSKMKQIFVLSDEINFFGVQHPAQKLARAPDSAAAGSLVPRAEPCCSREDLGEVLVQLTVRTVLISTHPEKKENKTGGAAGRGRAPLL